MNEINETLKSIPELSKIGYKPIPALELVMIVKSVPLNGLNDLEALLKAGEARVRNYMK